MTKAQIIEQIKEVNKHLNVCNSIKQLKANTAIELEIILDRKLDELREACTFDNDMQTAFNLTQLENEILAKIVEAYKFDDNWCLEIASTKLTNLQTGALGSLVKKGLAYDAYKDTDLQCYGGNFFPSDKVLDFFGLQHY